MSICTTGDSETRVHHRYLTLCTHSHRHTHSCTCPCTHARPHLHTRKHAHTQPTIQQLSCTASLPSVWVCRHGSLHVVGTSGIGLIYVVGAENNILENSTLSALWYTFVMSAGVASCIVRGSDSLHKPEAVDSVNQQVHSCNSYRYSCIGIAWCLFLAMDAQLYTIIPLSSKTAGQEFTRSDMNIEQWQRGLCGYVLTNYIPN